MNRAQGFAQIAAELRGRRIETPSARQSFQRVGQQPRRVDLGILECVHGNPRIQGNPFSVGEAFALEPQAFLLAHLQLRADDLLELIAQQVSAARALALGFAQALEPRIGFIEGFEGDAVTLERHFAGLVQARIEELAVVF